MRKRDISLKRYGISGKRYKELCGFCEQYPEWKNELYDLDHPLSSVKYRDMPGSPNKGMSDLTGNVAVRAAMLRDKVKVIEETAQEASPEFAECLIDNICYEIPVNCLIMKGKLNLNLTSFSDIRRYFFYLLDKKR